MKQTMKMVIITLFFFSFTIFSPSYAYDWNRNFRLRNEANVNINKDEIIIKDNEKSKIVGYLVFGALVAITLGAATYWLSTKGPDYSGKNTEPAPNEGWKNSSSGGVYYDKSGKRYVLIKKDDGDEKSNADNSENKKEYNILSPF